MLIDIKSQATLAIMERLLMAAVREKLVSVETYPDSLILGSTSEPKQLFVPVAQHYSMGRFDLKAWPRLGHASGNEISKLESLFRFLFPECSGPEEQRLLAELQNSRQNTEDSLLAKAALGIGRPGQGTLADWEGRVWLGHPLHPGARLRSGVTPKDNRRYGPEWQPWLVLPLLEMPRQDLMVHGELWSALSQLDPRVPGFSPEQDVVSIPVHPWSADNDLRQRFSEKFLSGRWKFSHEHTFLARPTMSFRSVVLSSPTGQSAHLKLPVAVQTTGATRTVSVAAAYNGPKLSHFLEKLWQHPAVSASGALGNLHLMPEVASFHLADDRDGQARFLSGILRLSPPGPHFQAPAAALLEPVENPLFLRLADYYGISSLALWSSYCLKLIPPLAYLCGRLGLALEAHPQNVVAEFRGAPGHEPDIHFHYRDLGGIRLHPGLLASGLADLEPATSLEIPQLYPGSATSTTSTRELASKFVYSVLQNHLGELCRAIVRQTGENEQIYWDVVKDLLWGCRHLFNDEISERVFSPTWDLKALWRMRISSAITEYTFLPVDNPCRPSPQGAPTC